MKIKFILILSLFLVAVSCSKDDEPVSDPNGSYEEPVLDPNGLWSSWQYDGILGMGTPKGWAYFSFVEKSSLPDWLVSKTEEITRGYILKTGSGDELLYFVYDEEKKLGQLYDGKANQTKDDPKNIHKAWEVIYRWNQ